MRELCISLLYDDKVAHGVQQGNNCLKKLLRQIAMGTDSLNSQSGKKKQDKWQGETRNSVLGADGSSSRDSPTAHDTATSFQSDQQYSATAFDPVVSKSSRDLRVSPADISKEQVTAAETPAEEVEEERAKKDGR
jgi:hypothetical protein